MDNFDIDINNILNKYKVSIHEIENTKKPNFINTKIKKIFVINLADNIIRRNYILTLMKKYSINFSLIVVNRITKKTRDFFGNKNITKEELGCTLSHMWCLREIINKKYENSIIFEDDIIFHKNFKEMFVNIFQNNYDFLLLGACDFSFKTLNKDLLLVNNTKEKKVTIQIENDDTSETTSVLTHEGSEDEHEDEDEEEIQSFASGKTVIHPKIHQSNNEPFIKNMYRPHKNSIKVYGAHANYYSLEGAKMMYDINSNNISFFDKFYMTMFKAFENTAFICYPNLIVSDISTTSLNHCYPFFSKAEELYYINCFDNFNFQDYNFIYLDIILKNKGVEIRKNDTYKDYITRLIRYQFSSEKEREVLKNRHVFDFFTIRDLEKIRLNI